MINSTFHAFCHYLAQVSELIILNEASERDGVALPDLVPSAQYISEAIENLVASAHKLLIETADEVGT